MRIFRHTWIRATIVGSRENTCRVYELCIMVASVEVALNTAGSGGTVAQGGD